jgi:hypothetical protein
MIPILFILKGVMKQSDISNNFRSCLIATIIIIIVTFQTPVLLANLEMFDCTNLHTVKDPEYYLNKDFDMPCWSGQHLDWVLKFSLSMVILWGFMMPILLFLWIRKHRNHFNEEKILIRFGYLLKGIKHSHYYWEFYVTIWKYLLVIIITFGSLISIFFQLLLVFYVVLVGYILESVHQPFLNDKINRLETWSKTVISFTTLSGFYFTFVKGNEPTSIIFTIIPYMMTGIYILLWLFYFLFGSFQSLRDYIENRRTVMKKILKYSCLRRILKLSPDPTTPSPLMKNKKDKKHQSIENLEIDR